MKSLKYLGLILLIIVLLPIKISAKRYYLEGTDLNILLDDSEWYVFTRGNLYNNPELEELGLTYEYLYNFMHNNAVYLDAALFYEDDAHNLELFIRKKLNNKINNLSKYSNDDVMDLAKSLANKQDISTYDVYESDYKYVYLNYYDSSVGYHMIEYVTVINGQKLYNISSKTKFFFII